MQHTQVVSSTPGRTRFKLPDYRRNPQDMAQLASGLQAHPDVHDVQYNVQTGSILVHHNQGTFHDVCSALRDLGCLFTNVTGTADLVQLNGKSDNSSDFNSAITDLNQQILAATNGIIDLRFILPIGLGSLAVLQFLTFGWQFDIVPWFVLAYFAVDSFFKLNFPQDQPATSSN